MTSDIKVGTTYTGYGKRKDICTVVDKYTTTNLAGGIVNVRYVSTHDLLGQKVFDYEVPASTIERNLINY